MDVVWPFFSGRRLKGLEEAVRLMRILICRAVALGLGGPEESLVAKDFTSLPT